MKLKSLIIGLTALTLTACSQVPAGYKGVIVNLYGSDKGVSEETVGVGRYYLGWNRELYLFPIFLQTHTWSKDDAITMQTSEGLAITTDVGITYSIKPENVTKVFQRFRMGIDEITHTFLHNRVRDAMNEVSSTMTVEELYGQKKDEFITKVNKLVHEGADADGIEVEKVYLIGTFDLPETVITSINAKIQATQNAMRTENEVQSTRAEAQKTIVQAEAEARQITLKAEAQAKANRLLSESVSPAFIQYQAVQKWNGVLPAYTTSGSTPFINIPVNTK